MPWTPEEIDAEADQLQAALAEKRAEVALLEHRIRALRVAAEAGRAESLPLDDKTRTVRHEMQGVQQVEKKPGRPLETAHPFPRTLVARGSSVAEWAEAHGLKRVVVRSWYAPKPDGRRIPAKWAKAIEREFKIPATEAVWSNGIRSSSRQE